MAEAFICDYIRTPIGRYGGALSSVRTDDLAAIPIRALMSRNSECDWKQVDDVIIGCANQAGEDNRNVARMAALLAGLDVAVSGVTVNRLCGSGMDAVITAARAIKAGEGNLYIAGGVESMSRAPFVFAKASKPFSRNVDFFDTTIGWRFINVAMRQQYGVDSMPETAENLAAEFSISRVDQDAYAFRSQQRAEAARIAGYLSQEIMPVDLKGRGSDLARVTEDEHPRADTTMRGLASLPAPFATPGTVTAGNSSGVNDGAATIIVASEQAIKEHGLVPRARIVSAATAGVEPRIMGFGPVPAIRKLCANTGLSVGDFDVIELNEAFSAQVLVVLRSLQLADDANHVNPNGGAIALGHPLGASGTRIVGTVTSELQRRNGRYAIAAMCIGVGQGIAIALERC